MADQEDTLENQLAPDDQTPEEQDEAAEDASQSDEEGQDASDDEQTKEERLLAGKYKTVEALEAAYEEIQRFTGGRKELEEKAREYDRLVVSQARSAGATTVQMPKLSQYVLQDGSIDVARYDAHMEAWNQQIVQNAGSAASRLSNEQLDMRQAETDFPYLVTDAKAAKAVMAMYRSGGADSIYDAAVEINSLRSSGREAAEKEAIAKANHELSKKSRGTTERVTGKTSRDTGEMTEAKFAQMSPSDQKAYIERQFNQGSWGTP
jgi:hypothetical protein